MVGRSWVELGAAAAPDPLREARAHAGEAHEDRPVDRRRLAPEDGGHGRPSDPAPTSSRKAVPRERSRSCAATYRRHALPRLIGRRRPDPRHVQPDRHHHRADLEREPEPPEHPGPHRGGQDHPAAHSRMDEGFGLPLTADYSQRYRTADPPAPGRGSGPDRRVHPRPRRAHRDRVEGVPGVAEADWPRPSPSVT